MRNKLLYSNVNYKQSSIFFLFIRILRRINNKNPNRIDRNMKSDYVFNLDKKFEGKNTCVGTYYVIVYRYIGQSRMK